jgi:RNA polymerase sigma-70 factor (ECF subfamily)
VPALDPQSLPRHLDRLYRAAWALCGSPHDAEDLVQETFARVLARPRRLRGNDELAYLMTVLRNTFLTERRTAARRPRTAGVPLEELEPVDPRTGARPEESFQAREVFAVIATLPERYRLALVAVDLVGLSYREAAAVLETREATIATRVFRAREQVARRLAPEDEDEDTPSEAPAPEDEATPGRTPALEDETTPGGEPAPDDETTPGRAPALEVEPTAGPESAPEDGSAPAPARAQREGQTPRRRLTQRGPR